MTSAEKRPLRSNGSSQYNNRLHKPYSSPNNLVIKNKTDRGCKTHGGVDKLIIKFLAGKSRRKQSHGKGRVDKIILL
jgi:hypothetical protein